MWRVPHFVYVAQLWLGQATGFETLGTETHFCVLQLLQTSTLRSLYERSSYKVLLLSSRSAKVLATRPQAESPTSGHASDFRVGFEHSSISRSASNIYNMAIVYIMPIAKIDSEPT